VAVIGAPVRGGEDRDVAHVAVRPSVDDWDALVGHLNRMGVAELMGANRRLTPAAAAVRRSCRRADDGSQWRPAVGPWITQKNAPTGS